MPKAKLTVEDRNIFFAKAAHDFIDFCIATDRNYDPQWFHEEIARALEAVERGEIKRLMIEMPPRHGKSEEVSVKFPAWILGRHPDWPIINASYASGLSEKHSGECRDTIKDKPFKAIFPKVNLKGDTTSKEFWQVESGKRGEEDFIEGGGYQACGVGGSTTGFGAKILIIDDPVKNREEADSALMRQKTWEWYSSVARTRLEDGGAIIVIMTRWHEDDLAGRLLATGQPWHRIRFPALADEDEPVRKVGEALWPGKYPVHALEELRAETDERTWFSLYQQNPRKSENQSFNPDWFTTFEAKDLIGQMFNRYAVFDVADSKRDGSDFTGVGIVDWTMDDVWHVSHVKRHKVNIAELIDLIFYVWITWKPLVIGIEKKAYADQVKPLLDAEAAKRGVYPVVEELEHRGRSKESRILGALQGRAQHKRIKLQADPVDDTPSLKAELWSFPRGRFDDLIDAVAYVEDIGKRPHVSTNMAVKVARNREEQVSYR
jgi:hypothetical protein